jgi:hypothetical protein
MEVMEHWEYLAIKFESDGKWKDSSGRIGQLNNNDFQQGHASLIQLANQLGSEGWELIINDACVMDSGHVGTLIFKRQRA